MLFKCFIQLAFVLVRKVSSGGNVWNQSFLKLAQYPIVETERLLLRPVTLDDAEAMFDYASDKDNTRYTFLTNQKIRRN